MRSVLSQPHIKHRALLYVLVFNVVYTRFAILFLFAYFLLYPIGSVLAAEEAVTPETDSQPTETASVESSPQQSELAGKANEQPKVESTPAEETQSVTSTEEYEDEPAIDASSAIDTPITDDVENDVAVKSSSSVTNLEIDKGSTTLSAEEIDVSNTETAASSTKASSSDNQSSDSLNAEVNGAATTTSATTTPAEVVSTDVDDSVEVAASTTAVTDPEVEATPVPLSPEPVAPTPNSPSTVDIGTTTEPQIIYVMSESTSDLNRHVFSDDECVSVGDGSYYCSQNTAPANMANDPVYAAPDATGNHEIFFRAGDKVRQLTANQWDDRSPQYDPISETVVWHRLIDGRYQIISFDLTAETETQLTNAHTNHMEPARSGDVTVWQQWEGDDWEIAALIDGEIKLLTNNERHDVAPTVKDGYIMWHVTNSTGDKLLSVYEIATGMTSDIADPDGGQVENPRFVLVYDTKFDNGDLVTKTYDPDTGEVRPVGSQPAPPPALPDPEPAGETSALIQTKPTGRDANETATPTTASSSPSTDDPELSEFHSNATTTPDETISDVDLSATSSNTLVLTDFDLIVEPYDATSSAQTVDSATSSDSVE